VTGITCFHGVFRLPCCFIRQSHAPIEVYGSKGTSMKSPRFVHRTNPDGTIDSICKACFVTIASSMWEADLESAEGVHICGEARLQHLKELAQDPLKSRPCKAV
jgi:hypothetical protein